MNEKKEVTEEQGINFENEKKFKQAEKAQKQKAKHTKTRFRPNTRDLLNNLDDDDFAFQEY